MFYVIILSFLCYNTNMLIFFQMPSTSDDWLSVAKVFGERWNYPNCVGSVDGKHVVIQCPPLSVATHRNYKGTFSIILMALVDGNYNFMYAHAGTPGKASDGGVFVGTSLYGPLEREELLPEPRPLPGSDQPMPFIIVADDAFPLTQYMMKPYSTNIEKGTHERIYNYRHSRARRIVENAFGVMASVFRVFRRSIPLTPEHTTSVVLACVHLHNFLRRNSVAATNYCPPGTFDTEDPASGEVIEGRWRANVQGDCGLFRLQNVPRNAKRAAKVIRDNFKEYFVSDVGKVHWQDNYA